SCPPYFTSNFSGQSLSIVDGETVYESVITHHRNAPSAHFSPVLRNLRMPKIARLTPRRIPLEEAVGVSSAGFVGATPDEARQNWAEESRHRLTGPGAYEWWYFQALSEAG